MKGRWIVGILAASLIATVGYLLWPGQQDFRRALDEIQPHVEGIETALGECGDLLQQLEQRKSAAKKKMELGQLRRRTEDLGEEANRLMADTSLERGVRLRTLAEMEGRYWDLKRDAEDLRARLREMLAFLDQLSPVIADLGRVQRELLQAQGESTDVIFQQRAAELIYQSKVSRDLAENGLTRLSASIVEGRPISQAALRDLQQTLQHMRELLRSPKPGG